MNNIVGIIPARAGSKGIPRKNIKKIAGKPLIAWTIEAAMESRAIDRVIVSTDDEKILQIANEWGAEVPFIRPKKFATDTTTTFAVVKHAMEWLKKTENISFEYVMLLQPTSPLRTKEDICEAVHLMQKNNAFSVVSVSEAFNHPYLIKKINESGILEDFINNHPEFSQRQQLPKVFTLNGAIYLLKWEVLNKRQSFTPEGTLAYIMPQERSIDIDTPWDFFIAEQLLKKRKIARRF